MKRNFNFDEMKKKKVKRNVVEFGEVTGHAHRITENAEFFESKEAGVDCLLLKILDPTILRHEEHHKIELNPQNYKKRNVQEYNHFLEESKKVQD